MDIPVTLVAGSAALVRVLFEDDLARKRCPCDPAGINALDRGTVGNHSSRCRASRERDRLRGDGGAAPRRPRRPGLRARLGPGLGGLRRDAGHRHRPSERHELHREPTEAPHLRGRSRVPPFGRGLRVVLCRSRGDGVLRSVDGGVYDQPALRRADLALDRGRAHRVERRGGARGLRGSLSHRRGGGRRRRQHHRNHRALAASPPRTFADLHHPHAQAAGSAWSGVSETSPRG